MSEQGKVYCERVDAIAYLVIDRGHAHNAISPSMWLELQSCAELLAGDPDIHVVLLVSKAENFTMGFDLHKLASLTVEEVNRSFGHMEAAICAVESLPQPVLAVLDGYVLGGGLELAAAADLRIITPRALIGMPIARLGILLSPTFAWRLVESIGIGYAKDMVFTGRFLTGQEAFEAGFAHRMVEADVLHKEAQLLAERVANTPKNAVFRAKQALNEIARSSLNGKSGPFFIDPEIFPKAVQRFTQRSSASAEGGLTS